ncbi:MAG: hypothetical protein A2Z04_06315 [Chloroflexi bacterium RBG_16_57_9]|nr:MAG: hypothetical protein A2Z04_06315 [Chloroflexi bacterium RBG_16_57_9]
MVVLGLFLFRTLNTNRTPPTIPDQGGLYQEGLAGQVRYINPLFWQNDAEQDLVSLIFRGLTRIDGQGTVQPDLARRWTIDNNQRIYTLELRDDVRWHDGIPFTADDVVYTVGVLQDPAYQAHLELAALWRSVKVQAVDAHTVQFTLAEPFAPFPYYLTVGMLPAHLLAKTGVAQLPEQSFNSKPIGTGPFRVQSARPDQIVLEAFPDFYGPKPYLSQLEFRFYPNYQSLLTAYGRGEIKGISRVLDDDLSKVSSEHSLNLYSAQRSALSLIFLNLTHPIFQDEPVREALLIALDRPALLSQVLNGQGVIAHSPFPETSWAFDPNVRQYPFDPAQARRLLEEAGWIEPPAGGVRYREGRKLEFTLTTNSDPGRVALANAIREQWAKVGAQVEIQVVDPSQLRESVLRPRKFDAVLFGWNDFSYDPDPYPLWHSSQVGEDGQNYSGYLNTEVDSLLEQARMTPDQSARASIYWRFQSILADEVPAILLFHAVYHYAIDASVHNVQVGPLIIDPSDRFRTISQWYIKTRRAGVAAAENAVDKSPK